MGGSCSTQKELGYELWKLMGLKDWYQTAKKYKEGSDCSSYVVYITWVTVPRIRQF